MRQKPLKPRAHDLHHKHATRVTLRRIFTLIGPGFITGASDDDPSGIATYAVAGASFGFATLWTALLTFPLMAAVQFMCAKIAMITGEGLAGVLRRHYRPGILYVAVCLLLVANTINAGADIGAIGLIGAGMLAVPILTGSSAYAVAENFRWEHGLDKKPRRASRFYVLIAASTLVGMFINFTGVNAITTLFWTAMLNGFLAPPLLVLIMLISNNRAIMGNRVNGHGVNVLGWTATLLMFAAAIALLFTWKQ